LNLNKLFLIPFLILCGFVSTQTLAKDKLDEPLYINESLFDLDRTIPPPPNPGTMEYKHEIEFMKAKIAKLNDSQKVLAISDATNETVGFFSDTISNFDINKLPKTKALFEKVKYNAGYESKLFKNHFMSKRPYQVDNDIHACVPPKPSNLDRSYPSGHTTMGYAMGIVLAELIPQKSKEIMERTRLYGENRINCGTHFPADVEGGQVIGTLVAKELITNKEFKLLMNEVREELVEAGLAQ
jgi:acid phosphatase (class A)